MTCYNLLNHFGIMKTLVQYHICFVSHLLMLFRFVTAMHILCRTVLATSENVCPTVC